MDVVYKLELVRLFEHDKLHFSVCKLVLEHILVLSYVLLDFIDGERHLSNKELPHYSFDPAPLVNL